MDMSRGPDADRLADDNKDSTVKERCCGRFGNYETQDPEKARNLGAMLFYFFVQGFQPDSPCNLFRMDLSHLPLRSGMEKRRIFLCSLRLTVWPASD